MTDIVESVQKVKTIIGDISSASQEQTSGIEQIHQALSQMDEVTQQNAALVEEAAAAAQAMQDQAAKLQEVVSIFKVDVMHTAREQVEPALPRAPKTSARSPVRVVPSAKPVAASTALNNTGRSKPIGHTANEWEEF